MDDSCIFCKIIKGDIPCSKVYEDDKVFAFLDIAPVNKGHTLVIPKEHHVELKDIPDDLLGDFMEGIKKVSIGVKEGVGCEGISLSMSNGEAAGQVVGHAHMHVIPRLSDDGLKLWPQGKYEENEAAEVASKIKDKI